MTLKVVGNFLNISDSQRSGQPGENVTLTLTTTKDSIVALRAVDQSVLSFDTDNDITQKRLDASASDDIFEASDLRILSNREVDEMNNPWSDFRRGRAKCFDMEADRDATYGPPRSKSPEQIRAGPNIPETWIWEELSVNENSTLEISRTFPSNNITSWVITGFSLNSGSGIGILQSPTKISRFEKYKEETKDDIQQEIQ